MKPKIFRDSLEWECDLAINQAKQDYQCVEMHGVDVYTPSSYHAVIADTLAAFEEVLPEAAKVAFAEIKLICAFKETFTVGYVRRCVIIRNDYTDTDFTSGGVWSSFAGYFAQCAQLAHDYFNNPPLSVFRWRRLTRNADALNSEIEAKLNSFFKGGH